MSEKLVTCEICGYASADGLFHHEQLHKAHDRCEALEKRVEELEKAFSAQCGALGESPAERLLRIEERLDNLDHADRISDV